MKERTEIDDTAEDLQSIVDQQLINKNFDTGNTNGTHHLTANKYNSSSFTRDVTRDAKHEDNINPQPPASIPNNEQHEIPTIAKKQQPP